MAQVTMAGHWTGDGTGVTVILPPPGTVGSGEVRGGAPATREFALLEPTRLVDRVDAVVLSGGSAFGLAAGHGVMELLRERGTGFATPAGVVPIVVGMSLFDASVAAVPPTAENGRAAALAALDGRPLGSGAVGAHEGRPIASRPMGAFEGRPLESGAVGAGAGATTGKWRHRLDPGGIGTATLPAGPAEVTAVVAVNAWGDVLGPDGRPVFGGDIPAAPAVGGGFQNTTIGVVLTNARLSKTDCYLLAQSGHTGYARAIHPAHSRYDGDAVVALATGEVTGDVNLDLIRAVATDAVAAAIRAAVIR